MSELGQELQAEAIARLRQSRKKITARSVAEEMQDVGAVATLPPAKKVVGHPSGDPEDEDVGGDSSSRHDTAGEGSGSDEFDSDEVRAMGDRARFRAMCDGHK